jgi:hypothetical protein
LQPLVAKDSRAIADYAQPLVTLIGDLWLRWLGASGTASRSNA